MAKINNIFQFAIYYKEKDQPQVQIAKAKTVRSSAFMIG